MIIRGAEIQSPQLNVPAFLSDQALAPYPTIDQTCLDQLGQPDSYGGIPPVGDAARRLRPHPAARRPQSEQPGRHHEGPDPDPPGHRRRRRSSRSPPTALNQELVALGDQVTYSKYPGVDHVGITSAAEAEALAFMEKRLPPG